MSDKLVNTEKYQGTGRLASALGTSWLYAIPTAVTTYAIALLTSRFKPALAGKVFVGVYVATPIVPIYGAIRGWKNAGKAKEQFETLKTEHDAAVQQVGGLTAQVDGLNQEVGVHRKRFADEVGSRAEHGSHAGAHEAQAAKSHSEGHAL